MARRLMLRDYDNYDDATAAATLRESLARDAFYLDSVNSPSWKKSGFFYRA